MPSPKQNLLTELFDMRKAVETITFDVDHRLPHSMQAVHLAGNQPMLDAHARDLMLHTAHALVEMIAAGSSVDVPAVTSKNIFDALSDAWDDAMAEPFRRTQEAAGEEARSVAA